ncbi:MutS-related protein [uncultured Eubacterium sp.]|uniref:MutS-related protein n=1 Tax=uncultured Eubacterium sp. TaxID=165185 RepID=UPI0025E50C9D|nr:hypothetical protein [uncultured Eubacterium sp.]
MTGFRFLYPPEYDPAKEVKMKSFEFIRTLQIDDMVVLQNDRYRGYSDLTLEKFFSADPQVLEYRQAIVEDLVEHPKLYEVFCRSVSEIQNVNDLRRVLGSDFSVDSALSAVRYLEMYEELVDMFADVFDELEKNPESDIISEGMKRFRAQIYAVSCSEEYQNLKREMACTGKNFGYLKSVTIGINLDENLRPKEAGIISINEKEFSAGSIINKLMKHRLNDRQVMMTPLYPLQKGLHGEEQKSLNYSMGSALQTIFEKSLRAFEPIIQNYYKENTAMFVAVLDDIRFLTAGVKFILDMRTHGFEMCRPQICSVEDKVCELKQVYNPMLAMRGVEKTVVSNEFMLDENGRFYIVTGPNHGGKSIFAYSVGMAQALCQLGLFVPAHQAKMSPMTGIFTHFPVSDENNFGKGRLESECARLSEILGRLADTDMLLMDESFSSTSGLEAGYIASEVLTGIGVIGCCGLFVTHIHDLPMKIAEYNNYPGNRSKIDNLVAQMENKEDGVRSYRISRTTPDGLSYARDIAFRYGLNLEEICQKAQKRD